MQRDEEALPRISRLEWLIDRLIAGAGGGGGSSGAFVSVKAFGAKLNGVADDTTSFQNGFNILAGTGQALWQPGGIALISRPIVVPSLSLFRGSSSASIRSTITPSAGSYTQDVFFAQSSGGPFSTTLAANTVNGSSTVSLNAAPAIGIWLEFVPTPSTAGTTEISQVRSVTGTGPFMVTMSRPVNRAPLFLSGGGVAQVIPPIGILFDGEGMVISGTGDRAFEIGGAQFCLARNIVVNDAYGQFGANQFTCSFDLGSADSIFENIEVSNQPGAGIALEGAFRCSMLACRAINCAAASAAGINFNSSINCNAVACEANGCGNGVLLQPAGAGDVVGCRSCYVQGQFDSSTGYGANVVACECELDISVRYNALGGVIYSLAGSGISGGPVLLSGFSESNLGPSVTVQNDLTLRSWDSRLDASILLHSGGNINIVGGRWFNNTTPVGGLVYCALQSSGGETIQATGLTFQMTPAPAVIQEGFAFNTAGAKGTLVLTGCEIIGGSYGVVLGTNGGTGQTLRYGGNTVFRTQANAPTFDFGGNFQNRKQTVVANGATPVAVAWPNITASDSLSFQLQAVGGTPGAFRYTITPGTGFTFTGTAGDTSTYEYTVSP